MASMLCSFEMLGDKAESHARIVLKALQFAKDIGLTRRDLFRLLKIDALCLASNGVLVGDISWLAEEFFVLSFNCIHANCNKAAQALATEALSSSSKLVWMEDFPAVILPIVQSKYQ